MRYFGVDDVIMVVFVVDVVVFTIIVVVFIFIIVVVSITMISITIICIIIITMLIIFVILTFIILPITGKIDFFFIRGRLAGYGMWLGRAGVKRWMDGWRSR